MRTTSRPPGLRLVCLLVIATAASAGAAALAARVQDAAPPAPGHPPPAPVQPIPYSHNQHFAVGLECLDCHVNPAAGPLMTYPATSVCMSCHATTAADRPAIRKLAAYAASGTAVPWVRVYQLPDFVYWSHASHLQAHVGCVECHGPVADRDVVTRETNITTMKGCVTCHEKRQVLTDCGDCHEPRQ